MLKLQNSWGKRDQSDNSDNSEDYVDLDGLEDSLDKAKRAWNDLRGTWGKRDASDWASMKGTYLCYQLYQIIFQVLHNNK